MQIINCMGTFDFASKHSADCVGKDSLLQIKN